MLELVNLSNYPTDNEGLIHNSPKSLAALLNKFDLDGIELMLCQPWDQQLHRGEWVKGIHLRFWPDWLDFYCGNNPAVEKFIGDKAAVKAYYGAMKGSSQRPGIRMASFQVQAKLIGGRGCKCCL